MKLDFLKTQPIISNIKAIQNITGVLVFVISLSLLFIIHFFPEYQGLRTFHYFAAVSFCILGALYYFTPLGLNPKFHLLPYLFFPPAVAAAMFIIPPIAPLMVFIFFGLNSSYALTFGSKKLPILIAWNGIFLIGFFLIRFGPEYSFIQKFWISSWLLVSLAIYGYRDYRFGQELLNQRLEVAQMQRLTSQLGYSKNVLAAERNKLFVTLASITDGVIALDQKRRILFVNRATQHILGMEEDEILGRLLDEVLEFFDDQGKIIPNVLAPVSPIGSDRVVFQTKGAKLKTPKGKVVFVNLTSSKIREGQSINLGCILTLHDVTREKELEEMQLDFVSIAAHELRTPVTSLRGYISFLQDEIGKKLTGQQKLYLERIVASSEQLVSLMSNLLNVSRIEKGTLTLDLKPLVWSELTSQTTTNFINRAKQKNITLKIVHSPAEKKKVMVDKTRIVEVLENFVDNAINHTQEGGRIEISTEEKNGFLVTNVTDNGEGIPPKAIPQLFTKFYRVKSALESGAKGTGLGLFISKSIVEMHKGQVWVKSRPGHGSTFSFSVPIAQSQAKEIKVERSLRFLRDNKPLNHKILTTIHQNP